MTKSPIDLKFGGKRKRRKSSGKMNTFLKRALRCVKAGHVFYDGPPTANGKPHNGHVETRVIGDMILKIKGEGLYGSEAG